MKRIIIATALLVQCAALSAQSRAFNLGKWTEIQGAILKELNRTYVDSLPIDRIEKAGINAMLSDLDPYTIYVPEEDNGDLEMMISKTYGGIGAVIFKPDVQGNVIINEPYEGSPAQKFGLQCGDEIQAIDGVTVHGLSTKESSDKMKGKPGTKVVFTVKKLRSGEVKDITVTRERIHLPDVEYSGMIADGVGYILLSGFTEGAGSQVASEMKKLKEAGMNKLFLDLRGNGGGLLQEAVKIVSLFVPKGSLVVSAKGMLDSESRTYMTETDPVDTAMPLVVLVDSGSASSSEIVAGALQDMDRATIMGGRTFGKGLVQGIRPLPYGGQLKVTTAKYYTPSGRCVQAIDYSRRNEDGSVGHIPDSLTHEFRTAAGRIVRDGGGITPDVKLDRPDYSRLTYSLVYSGVIEQYALDYVRTHESIPEVDDFHFSDADYENFIAFAKEKKFDSRSSARTLFDQMKEKLKKEGLADSVKNELDTLEKTLDMDKESFLRLKKAEIIPFIEEEIVVRFYFQKAGVRIRLRQDRQLKQALDSPLI